MSTFLTIPLEDIRLFLKENNLKIPRTDKAIYTLAWEALSSGGEFIISSLAIKDFLLAYNSQGHLEKKYKTSTLLISSDDELRELSNLVGLSIVRKDRLIRILGYLGLLINDVSTFDTLPKDALWIIGTNLDCQSITMFRSISKRFAELFNEKEIVKMLKVSLRRATSLDLTTYNRKELDTLCTFEKNKGRVASGGNFYLAIVNPNKVVSWGSNQVGELGNGKVSKRTTKVPKVIPGLTNIKMVAAGHVHSLALDFQGRVYSFGSNSFGQLGLGKNRDKVFTPTLIPDLIDITAIFAYGFSSMALNRHGEVYEFGFFYADFGYSETGDIIADNHPTPHLLELKKIVTISLGLANGLFLDSEGQVYGCGENNNYSLGLASNQVRYPLTLINHLEKIVSISATRNYSLFLNDQGMVFMLGDLRGETRYSGDLKTIYPILLPGFHNIISTMFLTTLDVIGLDNQGKIWKLDYGNIPDLDDPVEITPLGQKVVGISYNNQGDILIQDNGRVESYSDINETPSSLITLEIY